MSRPLESSADLPAWARWLDAAVVVVLTLTVFVAAFGGFRVRVGWLRLSITSLWPLVLWGVGLAVGRHLLMPREPIHRRVLAKLWSEIRSQSVQAVWPLVVGTRIPVLVVGYIAVVIIGYPPGAPPYRVSENEMVNLPVRWDTGWYLRIAAYGYEWDAEAARQGRQQSVAFFPALPLLLRAGGRLLGDRPVGAGLIVSGLAFLAALTYLYRLAREHLDHPAPEAALALLSAYPFAYFFSAIYTEPLFLLTTCAAFYHLHRGETARAAAWGVLAGLTRPNGALLSVPLLILVLDRARRDPGQRRRLAPALAAAGAPVFGMALFSSYIFSITGHPFAWVAAHGAWGRTYRGLDWITGDPARRLVEAGFYEATTALPIDLMNGAAGVLALALVWPVIRRFGPAYGVFILINLLPALFAGGWTSVGRLTSVLFPVFLWLAWALPGAHVRGWIAAFGVGQGLGAVLFFTWRPLF